MSGKHDRSLDDEQSTRLLMTGPIAIRGLGRSVKDAFRPGTPSRHRAFVAPEQTEGVEAIESALVRESGSSTQPQGEETARFPPPEGLAETGSSDGSEEDRVEDRRSDDDGPIRSDAEPLKEVERVAGSSVEGESIPEATTAEAEDGSDETESPSVAASEVAQRDGAGPTLEAESPDAETDKPVRGPIGADEEPSGVTDDEEQLSTGASVALESGEEHAAEALPDEGTSESVDEFAALPTHAEDDLDVTLASADPSVVDHSDTDEATERSADETDSDRSVEIGAGDSSGAIRTDTDTDTNEASTQSDVVAEPDGAQLDSFDVAVEDLEPGPLVVGLDGPSEEADEQHEDDAPEPAVQEASTSDATDDEKGPAAAEISNDVALAGFFGAREWTTAEELYSRPIPVQAAVETDEAEPDAGATDDPTAADSDHEHAEGVADRADGVTESEPSEILGRIESDQESAAPTAVVVASAAVAAGSAGGSSASGGRPPRGPQPPARRTRTIRERFGREAVGIAVLIILALVCGGLITAVVIKTHQDAALAAQEAAGYTPPPLTTPTPTATGPAVAVIGDGTTTIAASGVTAAQKWSALLGSALDGSVVTDASSGMGYAAKGSSGETFVEAAAKVPRNADVVVIFGGAEDAGIATLSVLKSATDTLSAAKGRAPDAKVIVVGPAIDSGASDSDLATVRTTLRTAARIAKATWVDPIDRGWLSESKQASASPSTLTAADERTIASKMEAVIRKAIR